MSAPSNAATDWLNAAPADVDAKTPLQRLAAAPARTAIVAGLRTLGATMPVRVELPWGGVFCGLLPEAVTSTLWRFGIYEAKTTRFIAETLRPGDLFVDIGAHFGYFTCLAAHMVGPAGRVVSIEAMPSTYARLKTNIEANKLSNVTAHQVAAFWQRTKLTFKDFGPVYSSLNTAFDSRGVLSGRTAPFTEIDIDAAPADELLGDAPMSVRMIKIDAESSEEFVLKGLKASLTQSSPIILIELGGADLKDAERHSTIFAQLNDLGYGAFRIDAGTLVPVPSSTDLPYDNYVFKRG